MSGRELEPGLPGARNAPSDLSVILVNYRSVEGIAACLAALARDEQGRAAERIVVDNESSEETRSAVRAADQGAQLVPSEENLGFAAAVNLACRAARGSRFLLLNPDCRVEPGAIATLLAEQDRAGGHGIVGPRTVFRDGSVNPTSCFRGPGLWSQFCVTTGLTALFRGSRLFDPETEALRGGERPFRVDIVSGCCLLIDRASWERLGGFDEAFFLYGEEFDLCLRAGRLGIPVTSCPTATVEHEGGRPDRGDAARMICFLRAKTILFERYLGRISGLLAGGLLRAWVARRLVVNAARDRFRPPDSRERTVSLTEVWRRRSEWSGAGATSSRWRP